MQEHKLLYCTVMSSANNKYKDNVYYKHNFEFYTIYLIKFPRVSLLKKTSGKITKSSSRLTI